MSATRTESNDVRVVKTWLAKHPRRAVRVALTAKDEDGEPEEIAGWTCSEMRPENAAELVAAVDTYAAANDRDCRATVVWTDKDGKLLQSRVVKRKVAQPAAEVLPALVLDGSPMAQAAQAQQHQEKMARFYMESVSALTSQVRDLAKTAIDMVRDVMEVTSRDRQEAEDLRAQIQEIIVTQAEAAAESADEAAAKAAEEKEPTPIELMVTTGMQMLQANAAAPKKVTPANGTPTA